MKHQNQPTNGYFGPRSVAHGYTRKSRNTSRFVSKPMKKIIVEVEKRKAHMQYILGNRRKKIGVGTNKAYLHKSQICPSVIISKPCKRNYSEKDQRGRVVAHCKQHLLDGDKVGKHSPDALKGDVPMAISPGFGHAFSSKKLVKPTTMSSMTSKVNQGLVNHGNNAKGLSPQPTNLKAMPGLVLNSKRRLNLNEEPTTWIHKGGMMNISNGIAIKDNRTSREERLSEEKPKSHDNDSEDENPTHRMKELRRKYIRANEDDIDDQSPEDIADDGNILNFSNGITINDNRTSREDRLLEEKPRSHDDSAIEDENPTHRLKKLRRKYIQTNEDDIDDQSPEDVADDDNRLTSENGNLKDCLARVPTPFVADCLKEQCHCCSKPINEPVWSGLFSVGNKECILFSGHLSTKSCEKVRNLSKSLSRVVEVAKLPRSKVWPRRWVGSNCINDNIGLYFFPHKMRPDKSHDELLKEVMENDLALRATMGDTEMLIFPSSLLPKRYQTFQMKYYLWCVFKPREVEVEQGGAQNQLDRTAGITLDAARIPPEATGVATDAATISSEAAPTVPAANHGETDSSNIEAPPGRMLAFIVKQTPRLEQFIQEMQREGALVMQGEMMSTGSWPGNIATVMQRGQLSKK
ncbi:unnamed protein product [Urochloa humidicola]